MTNKIREYKKINNIEEFLTLKKRVGTKSDETVQLIYNILNKNENVKLEEEIEKIIINYLGYYSYEIKYIHQKMHSCYEIISINLPQNIKEYLINIEKELN